VFFFIIRFTINLPKTKYSPANTNSIPNDPNITFALVALIVQKIAKLHQTKLKGTKNKSLLEKIFFIFGLPVYNINSLGDSSSLKKFLYFIA